MKQGKVVALFVHFGPPIDACRTLLNTNTSEHYQNWLNQQFWTGAELIACDHKE
jgi:hypothetical protein